jgi:hypothetical protein
MERTRQLDRLAMLELREIPRLRSALRTWVDDPYLARELHERREEAAGLRGLLDIDLRRESW